jgi:hypothetical protein
MAPSDRLKVGQFRILPIFLLYKSEHFRQNENKARKCKQSIKEGGNFFSF